MTYNHKLISDLAWSIESPCLLNETEYRDHRLLSDQWFEQQMLATPELFSNQDKVPHEIQTYLSKMPYFKLGHYFENLIAYWLIIHPNFEILEKNLIITSDKRTVGELDFIIKELSSGKIIHLEVAVKFFLKLVHNSKANYFGPNLKDNLELKFNKLFEKQIELSNLDITKHELKDRNLTIDEHWVILKGKLYTHDDSLENKHSWMSIKSFEDYNDSEHSQWIILNKTHWLSEISNLDYNFLPNEIHNKESIIQQLNDKQNQRLFASLKLMTISKRKGYLLHLKTGKKER